ncbi:hypothetical protein EPIB2_281 [Tritonibacter mobilis]|nr:hypothetical protein EPIB2_281 [Tritonibacter mobilis]
MRVSGLFVVSLLYIGNGPWALPQFLKVLFDARACISGSVGAIWRQIQQHMIGQGAAPPRV